MDTKIRVLVVDDQSVIRSILTKGLSASPYIEVVASAKDAWEARDRIVELAPDVMTLDLEMPRMNGLEFLKKLMPQHQMPVIMVSSHAKEGQSITLESLEAGAVDFVTKPDGSEGSMEKMIHDLIEKVIAASQVNLKQIESLVKKSPNSTVTSSIRKEVIKPSNTRNKHISLVAIGTSTGGTTALREILTVLPSDMPAIVVVQHMPEGFTKLFADRLSELSHMEVKEAEEGDEILPGRILIAPGGGHLVIKRKGSGYCAGILYTEKANGHRPSVDVLFESIANLPICKSTLGVILTGMGKDGAVGITHMKKNGSITFGQDEASSVIYGMPREAFELGGIDRQISLGRMAYEIVHQVFSNENN